MRKTAAAAHSERRRRTARGPVVPALTLPVRCVTARGRALPRRRLRLRPGASTQRSYRPSPACSGPGEEARLSHSSVVLSSPRSLISHGCDNSGRSSQSRPDTTRHATQTATLPRSRTTRGQPSKGPPQEDHLLGKTLPTREDPHREKTPPWGRLRQRESRKQRERRKKTPSRRPFQGDPGEDPEGSPEREREDPPEGKTTPHPWGASQPVPVPEESHRETPVPARPSPPPRSTLRSDPRKSPGATSLDRHP